MPTLRQHPVAGHARCASGACRTSNGTPTTDAEETEAKSLSSCLACFVLVVACCVVFGVIQHQNQKLALEEIAAGDKFFAEGKKAEAVAKYKSGFSHAPADRKSEIIKRSADIEAEAGHTAESRYWVEQGLNANLDITYSSPAARDVLGTIRRERVEAEAQRIAIEAKKKEEQAAKRAEQEAKARQGNYKDAANYVRDSIRANPQYAAARFPAIVRADAIQEPDGSWAVFGTFTARDVSGATIAFCYRARVRQKADGTWESTGGDIVVELDK